MARKLIQFVRNAFHGLLDAVVNRVVEAIRHLAHWLHGQADRLFDVVAELLCQTEPAFSRN